MSDYVLHVVCTVFKQMDHILIISYCIRWAKKEAVLSVIGYALLIFHWAEPLNSLPTCSIPGWWQISALMSSESRDSQYMSSVYCFIVLCYWLSHGTFYRKTSQLKHLGSGLLRRYRYCSGATFTIAVVALLLAESSFDCSAATFLAAF